MQKELNKIRDEEITDAYYPPKELANIIWGTCFSYKDIEKNNIKKKVREACFMIEKLYKIQELCKNN